MLLTLWAASLVLGTFGHVGAQAPHALVVELDSIIHPISQRFLERSIEKAEREGAAVVVVEIDTPGGLLTSTRKIVMSIFASPVPVVVYVSPPGAHAASAGTFITAAGHVAAMAPGTNIGAASPVSSGGEEIPETLKEKVFQDTAAEIRSIAERRGRPVAPLEATVLEAKAFTASEALELGLIDVVAENVPLLLAAINGLEVAVETPEGERPMVLRTAGLEIRRASPNFFEGILSFIADPNVSFLLLSLGGLGLFVELLNPGLIFPGVFGVLALVLAFVALDNLPASSAGIALILLAFALGVAEVYVSGFGVLGTLGIVSFVLGGILLFGFFGTPSPTFPDARVSPWVLAPAAAAIALVAGGLGWSMIGSRHAKPVNDVGPLPLVGLVGVVRATLNPEGTIRVRGEEWTAHSASGERIERGARVIVVTEDGAVLTVERNAE